MAVTVTQLRSFPFDRVKIDRSFADDAAVVRAVAALGASLGMRTTAEGVETFCIQGGKIAEAWSRFGPLTPESDDPEDPPA